MSDVKFSDSGLELPSTDQGASLKREVTKKRVRGVDGKERDASDSYISSLRALAGLNPNPQTY